MTSRDFCFWLQGYFEIGGLDAPSLDESQVKTVKAHLALVFKHEIDPGAGPPEHQKALDEIHKPTIGVVGPGGVVLRC